MTELALRVSRSANAVSRRHGEVARAMWQSLWPERQGEAVPITHVTNGVHGATWIADPLRELLSRHMGTDWERSAADPARWAAIDAIPDEELWAVRNEQRARLLQVLRGRRLT